MTKQLCESCKGLGCVACAGSGHVVVAGDPTAGMKPTVDTAKLIAEMRSASIVMQQMMIDMARDPANDCQPPAPLQPTARETDHMAAIAENMRASAEAMRQLMVIPADANPAYDPSNLGPQMIRDGDGNLHLIGSQTPLTHAEVERAICAGGIIRKDEWRKLLADEQAKTIIGSIGRLTAAGWSVQFNEWSPAFPVIGSVSKGANTVMLHLSPQHDSDEKLRRALAATADMLLSQPTDPDLRADASAP